MNQVYRALERLRAMLGADFTKCIALFFFAGQRGAERLPVRILMLLWVDLKHVLN